MNTNNKPPVDIRTQTHMFLLTLIGVVSLFLIWSFVGRLDVVSFAIGEVVPSSQVKTVQHLEGGIVADIMVREGDRVKAGQPLVTLEATASGADVQELTVRIASLIADVARLEAEVSGGDMVFPEGFEADNPNMARQARALFDNRRLQFENDMAGQLSLIEQRRNEGAEIDARLANSREKLKLLKEQVGISEELLKEDLTNRMLHLNLLKEVANLDGLISEDSAALNRLAAAINQEHINKDGIENRFRIEARQELDEKRRSLEELTNRVRKFEDSFQRSVLTSPVEGVVMNLHVVTKGGVIQPGGAVVDVVPVGDAMVIEAQLPPQDVGYVSVGQSARVQLASADGGRFDHLDGEVSHISPDTVETSDGQPYYKVRIKTERDFFQSGGEKYHLVPGVQVMCSIVTGSRSVMDYMASPFVGSFTTALQER
ncbi:MAG: HlyD family type I secretion periplasmic adaptor subunit [Magnetovibrio sp.]|nr:HlyD family type I secretion periplasmic adaptor subunit [Magnetovibrio sp.]